jgi:hypothetical protein
MWPSAFGGFNTSNFMGGRDLVRPFVDACRRNGLKVGLYYSPPDWHFDRNYMDFLWSGVRTLNPEFQPVGPDLLPRPLPARDAAHQNAFAALVRGQVEELLTSYGTIDLLWFDGKPAGLTGDQCITQDRIRQLQPGIVINPRLHGTGDFVTYERTFPTSRPSGWAEFCDAWTGTWSYTPNATFHATGHELGVLAKAKAKAWRMSYLLSNGPMSNGDMTAMAYTKMAEMQAWMVQHAESVSSSVRPLASTESASVPATARGTVRYLYEIPKYNGSPLPGNEVAPVTEVVTLSGVTKPGRVTLLRTGATLPFTYSGSTASITVAASLRTNLVDVVKVDLATTPTPTPTPRPTPTPTPSTPTPTPTGSSKLAISAVTASTNDGNVPANSIDGNLGTRWSASGDGQWIQCDLGATKQVESVRLAWYSGNTRSSTFDVLVSGSSSGPWTTLLLGGQSSGTTTALETYDISDTSGRYVRLIGHGNSVNTWNSLSEAEIWGSSSTPPRGTKIVVAAGAVTASTNDGNVPANTVDSNLSTRWSANGDGQWIQYDLSATHTVRSVKLGWYNGDVRRSTFDVLVSSSSAGPWMTAAAGVPSSGTTTALETYDVTDTSGRYVRVVGHGNNVNAWNSISESEVWGD